MSSSHEMRRDRTVLKRIGIAAGVLLVLVAIGLVVKSFMTKSEGPKKRTVHEIAVLKPPPPPPPPKPEPKPPEMKKEEVKIEQPQQVKDEPKQSAEPPEGKLGLDATGTGEGDGFGLEGRKGGRDITTIGGTGGGGNPRVQFAFYTNLLRQHFDEEFAKNRKLRASEYRIVVSVWLARDGRIQRYELVGSSGNSDTDEALKVALAGMPPLREPPPESMPQPVRLRITARGAG